MNVALVVCNISTIVLLAWSTGPLLFKQSADLLTTIKKEVISEVTGSAKFDKFDIEPEERTTAKVVKEEEEPAVRPLVNESAPAGTPGDTTGRVASGRVALPPLGGREGSREGTG